MPGLPLFTALTPALAQAFDQLLPWAAALLDAQGKIKNATSAFYKMLPPGINPHSIFELMDEDETAHTRKIFAQLPITSPAETTLALQINGQSKYWKLTYYYLSPAEILATSEDISFRVQTEKARISGHKQNHALLELVPLLLDPNLPQTLQEILPFLQSNPPLATQTAKLLEQIQQAATIASGQEQNIDLHAYLKQAIYWFASAHQKDAWQIKANLNATSFTRPALPAIIEQVFTSLLTQIKTFLPSHGHAEIVFTSSNDAQNWLLEIAFPQETAAQPAPTEIKLNVIKMLGGSLEILTPPEQMIWHLSLPLAAATAATTIHGGPTKKLQGKVLAVDDEEYIRIILQEMLTDQGLLVETAANGREALQKVMQQDFDLIFTDIKMPEMDGIELISCLRNLPDLKAKIIVITGNFQEELFQQNPHNIQAKIDGFINKPFHPDHITDILDYYLSPKI